MSHKRSLLLILVITISLSCSASRALFASRTSQNDDVAVFHKQSESEVIPGQVVLTTSGNYEIIVTYEPALSRLDQFALERKYSIYQQEKINYGDSTLLTVSPGLPLFQLLSELAAERAVTVVQPNYQYLPAVIDDEYYSTQWALNNFAQTGGLAGIDINAEAAWSVTTGSEDIIVAVLDSGVDINHPDLTDNIWTNSDEIIDGTDNDGNGFADDIHGWDFVRGLPIGADGYIPHYHGTSVAGVIAARQNNQLGISGVAPGIRIMPVNFMRYSSADDNDISGGTTTTAIAAITYAENNGARIVNASWGTTSDDRLLKQAIENSGMLFIAAAGNAGTDVDTSTKIDYPAGYNLPNLISVAAIDSKGILADFSNYGARKVHIAAPGKTIISTAPISLDNQYITMSGTSLAVPHVSGIAALALSVNRDLNPAAIKELLISGVKPLDTLGKTVFSAGITDAHKAVILAGQYGTADYRHQVIFRDWDNNLLKREYVPDGGSASAPSAPARSGYTFTGWSADFSDIRSALSIQAQYRADYYNVIFQDWDGTVLKSESVIYAGSAAAPAAPVREGYIFSGWDKDFTAITGNTVVKAQYIPASLLIKADAVIRLDPTQSFVFGLPAGSTVRDLLDQFDNQQDQLRIVSAAGQRISDDKSLLKTGMNIQLVNNTLLDQKGITIKGDLDGDGRITALDLLQVRQHLLGRNNLQPAYHEAGKLADPNQISALDLLQLKKHLLGQMQIR